MLATEQTTGEATAEQTTELAEMYVRLGSQSDEQLDRYTERVNELVTVGLGRANEEGRTDLTQRLYNAADWMRDMAPFAA